MDGAVGSGEGTGAGSGVVTGGGLSGTGSGEGTGAGSSVVSGGGLSGIGSGEGFGDGFGSGSGTISGSVPGSIGESKTALFVQIIVCDQTVKQLKPFRMALSMPFVELKLLNFYLLIESVESISS